MELSKFQRDIFLSILGAILVFIGGFITASYTISAASEQYVDLTSAGKVINDTAIITIFNNADRHSTNDITVYGVVSEEPLKLSATYRNLGSVLGSKQSTTLAVPLIKKHNEVNLSSTTYKEFTDNVASDPTIWSKIVSSSSVIKYVINCSGCKNDKKVETIITTFNPKISIQCLELNSTPCILRMDYYEWGTATSID